MNFRIVIVPLLLLYFNFFAQTDTTLILSEVMFYAPESNSEYIEIYNRPGGVSINLNEYVFIYQNSSPDLLTDAGEGTVLFPGQFAVVFEADYDIENGVYSDLIPAEALILKINNNAFGTGGMSNSGDRTVKIVNTLADTLSVYTYSADNISGRSDEKIIMNRNNDSPNWGNSDQYLGTPGAKNTITPFEHDLMISGLEPDNFLPEAGDSLEIKISILNNGSAVSEQYVVNLYFDENNDSLAQQDELVAAEAGEGLQSGEEIEFTTGLYCETAGIYNLIAILFYSPDQNPGNNTVIKPFEITITQPGFGEIVINEIMYAPAGGEPEWLELRNNTLTAINLKQWEITDLSSSKMITEENIYLQPGGYIIITDDSSIVNYYSNDFDFLTMSLPSLNNSGDEIKVINRTGGTVDSVDYLPSWGGSSGKSLEKIDPAGTGVNAENWGTSQVPENGTPGLINSITKKENDLAVTNAGTGMDWYKPGDQFILFSTVKNIGTDVCPGYEYRIYFDANADSIGSPGELVITETGLSLPAGDSINFSSELTLPDEGENLCIIQAYYDEDDYTENNLSYLKVNGVRPYLSRGDIQINEFMYAPDSPEPEWIEIYNNTDSLVNLNSLSISDAVATRKVINENIFIAPDSYFIFTGDNGISQFYDIPDSILLVCDLPQFNNSGDKIVLRDSLGMVLDSLEYTADWDTSAGNSLEKISKELPSEERNSWANSKAPAGGTPGEKNSVSPREYDISIFIQNTTAEPIEAGGTADLSVTVVNTGVKQADNFRIFVYQDTLSQLNDLSVLIYSELKSSLTAGDVYNFPLLSGPVNDGYTYFIAKAEYIEDLDNTNNISVDSVRGEAHNIQPGDLVINEFMYAPNAPEPEWIEIFNNSSAKINLNGILVGDSRDTSAVCASDIFIPSGGYMVIARDSSIVTFYGVDTLIAAGFPALNNTGDEIKLLDKYGWLIDSLRYYPEWDKKQGNSMEKYSPELVSTDSASWGNSISMDGATPGKVNSLTKKMYNIAVSEGGSVPEKPEPGENFTLYTVIVNQGEAEAEFSLEFYQILFETEIQHEKQEGILLQAGEEKRIDFAHIGYMDWEPLTYRVNVLYNRDQMPEDNILFIEVTPGYLPGDVIISEFMADPAGENSEWIELYNTAGHPISLKNWKLSELLPDTVQRRITGEIVIQPHDFLVFSPAPDKTGYNIKDAETLAFGTLNNNGDGIILLSPQNTVTDSISYGAGIEIIKGKSIERKDGEDGILHYSLSDSGATPGKQNSIEYIQPVEQGDLIINEIMYNPDAGNCQFVEFFNISEMPVNIGGLKISESSGVEYALSERIKNVDEGNYFIFSADSSLYNSYSGYFREDEYNFYNLNSLGFSANDEIILRDIFGNVIDSVKYSEEWHNKNISITGNRSLERINPRLNSNDPANWSTSADPLGASPGKENSIYAGLATGASSLEISPNPFSPDNDGFEDHCLLSYNLSKPAGSIRVRIYDRVGRLVRTLEENSPAGGKGSIIFDGLNDSGSPLKIGIYIVLLEAMDTSGREFEKIKKVVVVARKL